MPPVTKAGAMLQAAANVVMDSIQTGREVQGGGVPQTGSYDEYELHDDGYKKLQVHTVE
jgi:hypothetical protein